LQAYQLRRRLPTEKINEAARGLEAALFDAPVLEAEFVLARDIPVFVELREMLEMKGRAIRRPAVVLHVGKRKVPFGFVSAAR
jgi:hypothetical protein